MPPSFVILSFFLSLGGCAGLASTISPSANRDGPWVQFYHRDFPEGRLDYYYDPASIQRIDGILVARWRVTGSRDQTTTLYAIEIACRAGRFTERGTRLIDARGNARTVPAAKLLRDQAIETGTSGDVFERAFCP